MKNNKKNRKYTMREAVSYYILGYKRYEQKKENNGMENILRYLVEVVEENKEITVVNSKLLDKVNFDWLISSNDFFAYAVCIFYVLINKGLQITEEKIVNEFLRELHTYHPRTIIKEAEDILEKVFPELIN